MQSAGDWAVAPGVESSRSRPLVAIVNHRFGSTEIERQVLAACQVVELNARSGADLAMSAPGAAAVLVTSTPTLGAATFDLLPALRVVVRYGIGVDNVDVAAATDRGIVVCNVPHYGTDEVATHAVTLALIGVRRIMQGVRAAAAGHWSVRALGPVPDVREATFGVVGFGHIGRAVADKAVALGFHVIAHDGYASPERFVEAGVVPVDLDTLLATSDVVSLHAPLTDETRQMVDAAALARMKPTAFLVNTSRGALVDEQALLTAVDNDEIAGAALDVLGTEPPAADSPLLNHERIVVTPHAAWYSVRAEERLQRQAAEQVRQALDGAVPDYAINSSGTQAAAPGGYDLSEASREDSL